MRYLLIMCGLIVALNAWAIVPSVLVYEQSPETEYSDDDLMLSLDKSKKEAVDPTRWLFVIGAGEYENTDNILYSEKSADAFRAIAQKKLGISNRRTVSLIGKKATSGPIKDRLYQMMNDVQKGDTIYFYYSGHGIPNIKTRDAYILPVDRTPNTIVRDDFFKLENIYKTLNQSAAGKVVAIIDSCFSGSTDNQSLFKGVAAARLVTKKVKVDKTKMVVMTAGKDDQFSNMYQQKKHRAFSYFVMKSLLDDVKDIKSMFRYVRSNVEDVTYELGNQYLQTPTISGDINHRF
ncbi:MAG: caspase family protein [Gammaproteobacteria bacterium]|nr:caspase family protein [Gammaproteobacteria bacterium]